MTAKSVADTRPRWTVALCLLLAVLGSACDNTSDGGDSPDAALTPDAALIPDAALTPDAAGDPTVAVTVRLIDAMSGTAPSGAEISFGDQTVPVQSGVSVVNVPQNSPFEILATAPGYSRYRLFGHSGTTDFELISFVSSDSLTSQVMAMLGGSVDPTRGFLVVGMDTPSLQPAVGASVTIDATSAEPFIFAGQTPQPGNAVIAGGSSFVSFPNTLPGSVDITVTPPPGQSCSAFPGPGDLNSVDVVAGDVTVISYTCL